MASITFSYIVVPSLFYAIINEWIGLAPFLKSIATKLVPSLQGTPLAVAGWIGAGAVMISIYKALHKRWVQKKLDAEKDERRANPEGYQPFDVLAYKIFSGAEIPEDVVSRHQEAITFIQNTEPDVNERKKRILKEWENFDRYIRSSLDKGVYLRKEEIGSAGGFPFYPDNLMNRRASKKEKQRLFLVTHYAEVQKLQCEDQIKDIIDSGEFLDALKETMRGKTSVPKPLMVSLKKIVESDIEDRKKKKVASIRNSYYRRPESFRRRGLI